MSCGPELELRLSRYVDSELTPEERAEVEQHVGGCEPCRELLSLFQKNERLLGTALAGETFGNVIIDSVTRSLKGEPNPPEAKPVDATLWEKIAARPWLATAAALLVMLGVAVPLHFRMSGLQEDLARARRAADEAQGSLERYENQRTIAEGRYKELEDQYREFIVDRARRDAGPGLPVGYLTPEIRVKVNFDPGAYSGYKLYRKQERDSDESYVLLTPEMLKEPVYTDRKAKAGQGYYYKFAAIRPNGESDESAALYMYLPEDDRKPEHLVRLFCAETAVPGNLAVFDIERTVNGKPVAQRFNVKVGERIGGVRKVAGAGDVDFTTDFVLDKIVPDTQVITIHWTEPQFDPNGKPIIDVFKNGRRVPRTVQKDEPVGSRENTRAFLKPVVSGSGTTTSIWRGSSLWIRPHSAP